MQAVHRRIDMKLADAHAYAARVIDGVLSNRDPVWSGI